MKSAPSGETALSTRLWTCLGIVLAAVLLMSCETTPTNMRPSLPALPASVSSPCLPMRLLLDNEIATLLAANNYHMEALAECEVKRAGAVDAYNKARTVSNPR